MNRVLSLTSAILFSVALGGCEQQAKLRVDKVEPEQGVLGGGEHVEIRGSGFEPGKTQVEIRFGRRRAENVTISSATKIVVVTPPGDKGPVDVTLMFDNGSKFKIAEGFRYLSPSAGGDVRKAFFSGSEKQGDKPAAPK